MIYDNINNIEIYKQIIPNYDVIINFVGDILANKVDLTQTKIEILQDDVFALVNRYETKDSGLWEAHKKYIDIQWMLKGRESILFANLEDLKVTKEYDTRDDYLLLEGAGDKLTLSKGKFALFFPKDAHQPGRQVDNSESIVKIVIKIKIPE